MIFDDEMFGAEEEFDENGLPLVDEDEDEDAIEEEDETEDDDLA